MKMKDTPKPIMELARDLERDLIKFREANPFLDILDGWIKHSDEERAKREEFHRRAINTIFKEESNEQSQAMG